MTDEFSSLEEFDRFVESLDGNETEDLKIKTLSNSFLVDPSLLSMPDDPFSSSYRDAVLRIHAAVSGRPSYDVTTMEHTPLDVDAEIETPSVYRFDGEWLGNYLESFAHVIRRLNVRPGMRVVELGCGDAEISLHLARLGCDVTLIDIEPDYLAIVQRKAVRLGVSVTTICAPFANAVEHGPFERAFFYQAFHHDLDHQSLVASFCDLLTADGEVVLAGEPVIDPDGPWARAVPYPWGPRLDGLSLRAMRTHGWMELGFHKEYFTELVNRNGWTASFETSDTNNLVSSIALRREVPDDPLGAMRRFRGRLRG